jgi:phosphate transport system protein
MAVTHLADDLQSDIDRINDKVREMARMVDAALVGCMRAMAEASRQEAYSVILRDQRIDELEKEVERLSLEFLVRWPPTGRHLHFARAAMKINSQLERIGDHAESIARQVLGLCILQAPAPSDLLVPIANLAVPMVRSAVEAFTTESGALARRTMESEPAVEQLRHQLSHELLKLGQDGKFPDEVLISLQDILGLFERVADHALTISQEVLFLSTGEHTRHLSDEVHRVLFVDDENGSASLIAESIGNSLNQPAFVFSSAGLTQKSADRETLAFLRKKGLDMTPPNPKSFEQVPHLDQYQIIVGLSKQAQFEFPTPPTKVVRLDWSSLYPTIESAPSQPTFESELERTCQILHAHIEDLVGAVLADGRS